LKLVWDTYPARRRGDWDEVARVWRELNLEGRGAEIAKRVDRYKSSDEWKVRKCVFGLVRFLRELRDVDPDDGTPDESDDEYALSPEQLADIDKVRTEMREEEERNGCDLGDALKVFGITSAGDSYNLRRAGGVHPIHVFAVGWQVQKESGVKTPAALILSRLRSGEIPKITAKFIADIEPKPRIGPKQVKGY